MPVHRREDGTGRRLRLHRPGLAELFRNGLQEFVQRTRHFRLFRRPVLVVMGAADQKRQLCADMGCQVGRQALPQVLRRVNAAWQEAR